MSIEQLLFFLLLVAIPLLQRLIRAMRARTDASLGDRLPGPERETISGRRSPVSVPDVGTTAGPPPLPPALPKAIPYAAPEHIRASEREPRLRVPTPVPATSRRTARSRAHRADQPLKQRDRDEEEDEQQLFDGHSGSPRDYLIGGVA